jgi:inorganic pyrophosphatase
MSHSNLKGGKHKLHPWHGVNPGKKCPQEILTYIEVVPSDQIKYEIDKESGYLMIDRPQKYSNIVPALYGFIPQSYCAEKVAEFSGSKIGRTLEGDGDPLDIVVLTEREVTHGDILVKAVPIGGFRMIDGGEADDKIVAVLAGDSVYGAYSEISEVPKAVINRVLHYFLTYKEAPNSNEKPEIEITHVYGREEAYEVIERSLEDYKVHAGALSATL